MDYSWLATAADIFSGYLLPGNPLLGVYPPDTLGVADPETVLLPPIGLI